jgi:hypothetical protein
MKLIEVVMLAIFMAGILLAGSDSDDFTVFLWSKIAAACLFGATMFLINKTT